MTDEHNVTPEMELALNYIYDEALRRGDIEDVKACEKLIRDYIPQSSFLHILVMGRVAQRMTSDEWQIAISDIATNILGKD